MNVQTRSVVFSFLVLLSSLLLISCDDSDPAVPIAGDNAADEFIRDLEELTQPAAIEASPQDTTSGPEGDYICETVTYAGTPGFSDLIFKRSSVDVLYPGALLSGPSVQNGAYAVAPLARKPITLTVNLSNLPVGGLSRTVENPAYSTVQSTIHEILSQESTGADPGAEMTWDVFKFSAKAELEAKLGLNVEFFEVFGVNGDLNFGAGISVQRVMARFSQKYYDIVIDQPIRPSDFIDLEQSDLSDIQAVFSEISPMYISSVTYGRLALFYFESTQLDFDLKGTVEAFVDLAAVGAPIPGEIGGEGSLSFDANMDHMSCKGFILGGSSADAVGAAVGDQDAFAQYILDGGTYSDQSPGKPMSFTLRYLSNNYPVEIVMETNYTSTTCVRTSGSYRLTLNQITPGQRNGGPYGIYVVGSVRVRGGGLGNPTGGGTLFSHPSTPGYYVAPNDPILSINSTVVDFDPVALELLDQAWIEIDLSDMWYNWAFENHSFDPGVHRLYLDGLVPGTGSVQSQTYYNTLTIDYTVDALASDS